MKKYHYLLAAPIAALTALISLTACQPAPKAPEEFYILGNDGLYCDTEVMIVAQMFRLTDATPNQILPECTIAGKGRIVKVLERSINNIAVRVDLEGKPVWVMWVSLEKRTENVRVSPPKYTPIPLPEPVLTEMRKGKQYL